MNRFELEEPTEVTVQHVNLRGEKHGDETVPAVDLKLSLQIGNDVLSMFDGHLKSALYFKRAEPASDEQGDLEGVKPVSDMPNLRFPLLGPLKWEAEHTGYTLVIDLGLGGKSALQIDDCKVNNFTVSPLEGGTVEVAWRVQSSNLPEKVLGKLGGIIGHEVDVTLTGPEVVADGQGEIQP